MNNSNLIEHMKYVRGVVYDLGCGVRPYESEILSAAERYIGVDWSNSPHELQADIFADLNKQLPVECGVADTVVSFQVLEHLCEPQVMLNESSRILKPNGNILLAVPFQWWVHEEPYDYYRYTKFGLAYMLEKAGFVDIDVKEATGFWVMWLLKLNYQTVKLIRGPRALRWLIRSCLVPFWFVVQHGAPVLDRYWRAPQETAVYFVVARKP